MSLPVLYLVIPCYNEEEVLPITAPRFVNKLKQLESDGKISPESRVMFVNDGSADKTWDIICDLAKTEPFVTGISLSRNRGHQNAVLAGLMDAMDRCDITVSIDCDGQDDINAVDEMLARYSEGYEVVYGVRNDRSTDSFFKRTTAGIFYKIMRAMGVETVSNHADYRLISRRVLKEFSKFEEVNLFLRGMIPLVGFKSTTVYYKREERVAGKSHYSLGKMLHLAVDGITSLSVKPIRLITAVGFVISAASLVGVIWSFIAHFTGHAVTGWASIICVVCFFGGTQLSALGIIGEYIGKIYLETKRRPRYIISERTEPDRPQA